VDITTEDIKKALVKNSFTYKKPFVNADEMIKVSEIVNKLFMDLAGIYPAFKQSWDDKDVLSSSKRQWTIGFIEQGINNYELIEAGLCACRKSGDKFVPSIGEFIAMCLPPKKEIKRQSDTRPDWLTSQQAIESDEHKTHRMELGKKSCADLLKMLR